MRPHVRTKQYFIAVIIAVAVLAGVSASGKAEEPQSEKPGGNSKCYVCHPAMKTEELTTTHLEMGITCDLCHGASTEHMHDEMLMTQPDRLFGRSQVRKMCSTCHQPGQGREVFGREDHMNLDAVEAFFKEWKGRMRPNGRNITPGAICTDCHGTHNISEPLKTKSDAEQPEWISLFNGRDLKGWRRSDADPWTVKAGRIIGNGGTIWSDQSYEDYLFTVTFRAVWPIHAGIWTRGEDSPRVEIFESGPAFTGSVLVPGKGLALVNLAGDLDDRESWNTISIKVQGERTQVWLNGEEIGVIRATGPAKGRIGLHVIKDPASTPSELSIREILIRPLAGSAP